MTDYDFAEDVAEIRRNGEVAAFVPSIDRKSGPPAVNVTAANAAADDHHRVAVAVIGPAIAVLTHGPAELRHCKHDGVLHPIAEVGHERCNRALEVAESGPSDVLFTPGVAVSM